jgi:hypothetical protein
MSFANTTLSPELSEKIVRLESENAKLKLLLSDHDMDKMTSIMNELDDEKRISKNFEVRAMCDVCFVMVLLLLISLSLSLPPLSLLFPVS